MNYLNRQHLFPSLWVHMTRIRNNSHLLCLSRFLCKSMILWTWHGRPRCAATWRMRCIPQLISCRRMRIYLYVEVLGWLETEPWILAAASELRALAATSSVASTTQSIRYWRNVLSAIESRYWRHQESLELALATRWQAERRQTNLLLSSAWRRNYQNRSLPLRLMQLRKQSMARWLMFGNWRWWNRQAIGELRNRYPLSKSRRFVFSLRVPFFPSLPSGVYATPCPRAIRTCCITQI